ncbi:MAG TPA: type II secretion system F family protein [Vitreimonas sp.]|nr:type II secretion system F family protein [Vitreimonas sp.]
MPIYNYHAKNEHGEPVKGKVEAPSSAQAAATLRARNLLVIKVTPVNEGSFVALQTMLTGIKHDDVVNMTRQLSTMITAGLPLTQGLSILEQQSKPALAKLLGELKTAIEGGSTFAQALEKHPKTFSRVYIQLIRAGEAGGVLDDVLERLAENMEKDKEFRAKTKGALIYPVIVVIAMIVVAFVMMIFVIPKLTEMYKDFGAELPLATQLLIDTSNFTANFWWVILLAAAGGYSLFTSWGKTHSGRVAIDGLLLKMPIFGELRQKVILTEFARTLSLLLGSGISLLQALDIVSQAVTNIIYREALEEASQQVEKGISLAQAIGKYEMFPPLLSQMIAVGEETGKLDEVLLKLSVYFQSESEHAIKNMTTALEPMIMIVLGVGVGIMVIAIIMPIYNLTSQF